MTTRPIYALSLKQPWAALLAAGRKTIEIRTWASTVRGRVFIHAARVPDVRPEAWSHVTDDLKALAELEGGLIGEALLQSLVQYRSSQGFATDSPKHLNAPDWFIGPRMYGFVFTQARPITFRPYKGNVRFFTVDDA